MTVIDPKNAIGKKISFYDVKLDKKVPLKVQSLRRYSLAKGANKKRKRGIKSVVAVAKGNRKTYFKIIAQEKNGKLVVKKSKRKSKKSKRKSSQRH